ncbi:unnamed protein product [marine sediment metagenome]|jgi:hypothetical protein|uniref:Uncharacterized protein n=1 Tax=marine sediment metagenome TaxID=412755 RepID=X1JX74_9ZZZZ
MFQPQSVAGKEYPGIVNSIEIILNIIAITIIINPREKILFLMTFSGNFPFFRRILKTTLNADKKTNKDGPRMSRKVNPIA